MNRTRCSCSFPHPQHDWCDGNPNGEPFLVEIDFPSWELGFAGSEPDPGEPQRLRVLLPLAGARYWDPQVTVDEIIAMRKELFDIQQHITMYLGHPICAVSRSYRVYPAKNVSEFRGYLSKFEPDGLVENEQPTMSISITPTMEVK